LHAAGYVSNYPEFRPDILAARRFELAGQIGGFVLARRTRELEPKRIGSSGGAWE
jgi:hypothetical protein